jgi:hypothetical protein
MGLLCALLLTVAPAASAAPSAKITSVCPAGSNCWWPLVNYGGPVAKWEHVSSGCFSFPDFFVRSYSFYGGQEGYFYRTRDCSGTGTWVLVNTESPDIGFNAYSFKGACVSCRKK